MVRLRGRSASAARPRRTGVRRPIRPDATQGRPGRRHPKVPSRAAADRRCRPGVPTPDLALPVERRFPGPDEPSLEHLGGQRARADPMVDGIHLAEQATDLAALVAGEVGADPAVQVGGLADVEHVAGGVGEPVDAGSVGEPGGEFELGGLGMADQPGEVEQFLEPDDAERAGPLEEGVEQVAGGEHVGRARWDGWWGSRRVAARVPSLQFGTMSRTSRRARARVSTVALARRSRPVATRAWSRKERSKRRLWPTSTAPPRNSRKEGSIVPDRRGVGHHGVADAGQGGDERRDPLVGPDEGLVGAEQLAAPVPGGRHLGERATWPVTHRWSRRRAPRR